MPADAPATTLGVVVHPKRPIDNALDAAREWAEERGGHMRQIVVDGQERRVADPIEPGECDLIAAMGGDGTVLAALHAGGPVDVPVLGVACGSLGALTSVKAPDVRDALDRVAAGDASAREVPALAVQRDGEPIGEAFNDVVVVRAGAGQVVVEIDVGDGLFARLAGDGVIVATPLGSSAYTLAANGPLVAATTNVVAVTALAPHGGSIPPLVVDGDAGIELRINGGWAGARCELDGRISGEPNPDHHQDPFTLSVTVREAAAKLFDLDGETLIAGLRRRGVIADSPRMAARDKRKNA